MTEFYRLSGGGNDFLALVEPATEPSAKRIRAWCARGLSAGADGLFVLRRTGEGARMEHYNADGGPAALCVNATRCAARLALELGWAAEELVVVTGAGALPARAAGPGAIELTLAMPPAPVATTLDAGGDEIAGWRVDAGVPHFVLLWPRPLGEAPVASLGPLLRHHPALGEGGANVDFVRFPAPVRLEIRTWERGVEGETLACGSGVVAATAVGLASGRLTPPVTALTAGGFALTIDAAPGGRLHLAGDARIVASGRLRPEAEELPPPPAWS